MNPSEHGTTQIPACSFHKAPIDILSQTSCVGERRVNTPVDRRVVLAYRCDRSPASQRPVALPF